MTLNDGLPLKIRLRLVLVSPEFPVMQASNF